MLNQFEDMTLKKTMKEIVPTIKAKDYDSYKNLAHALKGASGYIGASRLHYVCYYIQEHHLKKRHQKMLEYYPSIVEAAIEFKVYSRKLLAEKDGKCSIVSQLFPRYR
jgi:HPt (histidine-containing phosphotransfer) domain-containing protein